MTSKFRVSVLGLLLAVSASAALAHGPHGGYRGGYYRGDYFWGPALVGTAMIGTSICVMAICCKPWWAILRANSAGQL